MKHLFPAFFAVCALACISLFSISTLEARAKKTKSGDLKVGDIAPNFTCPNENGKPVEFYSIKGKRALYFYPMDKTPGCTKQACSLRNDYKDLEKNGIIILGINYDSVKSHADFIKKHNLPFTLLSDEDHAVSKLYGVSGWFFPSRVTFLVDKNNKIVKIIRKIDLKAHAKQILNEFK